MINFADVQPGDLVTLVDRGDDSYVVSFRVQWLEVAVGAGDDVSNCSALYTAGDDLYTETSWRLVKREAAPLPTEPAVGSYVETVDGNVTTGVYRREQAGWYVVGSGSYRLLSWEDVLTDVLGERVKVFLLEPKEIV